MEPLIPRMWQESHRDWAMKTAMLMQERRTSVDHYVLISGVNFAVWTIRIHIRSGWSQSRYDPNSIRIDFGYNVDKALLTIS